MTRALSPIRTLMDMRNAAHARNDTVEAASGAGDWSTTVWSAASRIWSRQAEALTLTVISESPTSLEDVLSVLCCLAEIRDQHDTAGDQSHHRDLDVAEMTDVAIHNCVVALGANIRPEREYSDSEKRDVDWSAKQVSHWLPKPLGAWAELAAERARLDAAEDAAAAVGNDAEADAIQQKRFTAEDKLMAFPAPDGAALALKVLIAIGQDRASIPYQQPIEADARRLAGMAVQS